jgi:hypothetical protein
MSMFSTSFVAAALGLAVLASTPARADLMIYLGTNGTNGDAGCATANGGCSTNNTILNSAGTYGGWQYSLGLLGNAGATFPDVFNINNLDFTGTGSLTVFATETDLTYGAAVNILSSFNEENATDIDETRSLYLDSTNNGLTTTLLGCVSSTGAALCSADHLGITDILQTIKGLSGAFSLTEEIQVTSTLGGSGELQSEDEAFLVPEPISLSLFGSGLLALGAMSRRRRKASKSA